MGIKDEYVKWPLSRQLQTTFITAGLLISAIMIIITRLQLDWMQSYMIDHSESTLDDITISHMKLLGTEESNFLTNEFANYIKLVQVVREIDRSLLGYSDVSYMPLATGTPMYSQDVVGTTYDYAVYFSKYYPSLSDAGNELLVLNSAFDQILPFLYDTDYLFIYEGYYTDEIIYIYPGSAFSNSDYTPLVREWFYRAANDPDHVIITEPYQDAQTLEWIVTTSSAIKNTTGSVYGVAAVDVTLVALTEKTSSTIILDTGFSMLISQGGMILTVPAVWNTDQTLRIYNQDVTNISEDEWNVIKEYDDGTDFDYTDINGTDYIVVIEKIRPFVDNDTVTHYLLLFANRTELKAPVDDLENSFYKIYTITFWFVLTVSIVVFLVTIGLIYLFSTSVTNKLRLVENIFNKIIRRALFPKIQKGVRFNKLEKNSKGIEKLVEACRIKVSNIKAEEEKFSYYNWGSTRPTEYNIHSAWTHKVYPFNHFHDKEMPWKDILAHLDKVTTS